MMYRLIFLFACLVICKGHAVLPVIAPVVHALPAPVLTPYINHGYAGVGFGHGYLGKSLGHHIYKRSPHIVPVGKYDQIGAVGHIGALGHVGGVGHIGGVGHVGAVGHLAAVAPVAVAVAQPVAVSHQARVDVRTSPAVVTAPVIVKEVITPVIAPIYSKPFSHFNLGSYGSAHFGHKY